MVRRELQDGMRGQEQMVQKSPRSLRNDTNRSRGATGLRALIEFLEASNELIEDKKELRELGLTEEEIDGYEIFFADNYFMAGKGDGRREALVPKKEVDKNWDETFNKDKKDDKKSTN